MKPSDTLKICSLFNADICCVKLIYVLSTVKTCIYLLPCCRCRVKVLELIEGAYAEPKAKVCLVDSGRQKVVPNSTLVDLPPKFASVPHQVKCCKSIL